MDKKCLNCPEYKRCRDNGISWIFFIIGLIATVAIRVVTILADYNPLYGKIAWYIGIGGFVLFFIYKFQLNHTRSKAISRAGLFDRINQKKNLAEDDYKIIGAIFCSLTSKKERINYFFIFGLSIIVLGLAVYIDFFK